MGNDNTKMLFARIDRILMIGFALGGILFLFLGHSLGNRGQAPIFGNLAPRSGLYRGPIAGGAPISQEDVRDSRNAHNRAWREADHAWEEEGLAGFVQWCREDEARAIRLFIAMLKDRYLVVRRYAEIWIGVYVSANPDAAQELLNQLVLLLHEPIVEMAFVFDEETQRYNVSFDVPPREPPREGSMTALFDAFGVLIDANPVIRERALGRVRLLLRHGNASVRQTALRAFEVLGLQRLELIRIAQDVISSGLTSDLSRESSPEEHRLQELLQRANRRWSLDRAFPVDRYLVNPDGYGGTLTHLGEELPSTERDWLDLLGRVWSQSGPWGLVGYVRVYPDRAKLAMDFVLSKLGNENSRTRERALTALIGILKIERPLANERLLHKLKNLLSSDNGVIRWTGIDAIGAMVFVNPQMSGLVIDIADELMRQPDQTSKRTAIQLLGRVAISNPAVARQCLERVEPRSYYGEGSIMRAEAVRAIGWINATITAPREEAWDLIGEIRERVLSEVSDSGVSDEESPEYSSDGRTLYVEYDRHGHPSEMTFGNSIDRLPSSFQQTLERLYSGSEESRDLMRLWLEHSPGDRQEAMEFIRGNRGRADVRRWVIRALGELRDDAQVLRFLMELARDDPRDSVRFEAKDALVSYVRRNYGQELEWWNSESVHRMLDQVTQNLIQEPGNVHWIQLRDLAIEALRVMARQETEQTVGQSRIRTPLPYWMTEEEEEAIPAPLSSDWTFDQVREKLSQADQDDFAPETVQLRKKVEEWLKNGEHKKEILLIVINPQESERVRAQLTRTLRVLLAEEEVEIEIEEKGAKEEKKRIKLKVLELLESSATKKEEALSVRQAAAEALGDVGNEGTLEKLKGVIDEVDKRLQDRELSIPERRSERRQLRELKDLARESMVLIKQRVRPLMHTVREGDRGAGSGGSGGGGSGSSYRTIHFQPMFDGTAATAEPSLGSSRNRVILPRAFQLTHEEIALQVAL